MPNTRERICRTNMITLFSTSTLISRLNVIKCLYFWFYFCYITIFWCFKLYCFSFVTSLIFLFALVVYFTYVDCIFYDKLSGRTSSLWRKSLLIFSLLFFSSYFFAYHFRIFLVALSVLLFNANFLIFHINLWFIFRV